MDSGLPVRASLLSLAAIVAAACASGSDATVDSPSNGGASVASSASTGGAGQGGSAGAPGQGGSAMLCSPGATASCYSGPEGTEGVGTCHAGTKTCNLDGSAWGPCADEVLPKAEDCSQPEDEDCSGLACAQTLWAHLFGDASQQVARAVAVDPDNNVIIAGGFSGSIDFGAGALVSAGNEDVFVAKLSPAGEVLWSVGFGSAGIDEATAIAVDASGIVLTGRFGGTMPVGADTLVAYDDEDAFTIKLDSTGTPLWAYKMGNVGHQVGEAVAIDAQGNVYFGGRYDGTLFCGLLCPQSKGGTDAYLTKLTAAGNWMWSRYFGAASDDALTAIAVDQNGVVHIGGFFRETVAFGSTTVVAAGGSDAFLAVLDPQGNLVTVERFGGPSDDVIDSAVLDDVGDVVLSGSYSGSMNIGGAPLVASSLHGFIAKLASSGAALWATDIGPARVSVALDAMGNVAIAGSFQGTVNLGGGDLSSFGGSTDALVAKLDPQGLHVWSRSFGLDGAQSASSVAVDPKGNLFVAGSAATAIDFGTGLLTAAGEDAFAAAFAP